jgi:hypothetical protein
MSDPTLKDVLEALARLEEKVDKLLKKPPKILSPEEALCLRAIGMRRGRAMTLTEIPYATGIPKKMCRLAVQRLVSDLLIAEASHPSGQVAVAITELGESLL